MKNSSNIDNEHTSIYRDAPEGHSSSNFDILYCSHLWSNSNLRQTIIDTHYLGNTKMKYCYTCRGKIRKYEIKSTRNDFVPKTHSTPKTKIIETNLKDEESDDNIQSCNVNYEQDNGRVDDNLCIPSISRQVDSSIRQKYTSYEMRPNNLKHKRLKKSLKGVGCIMSSSLTDNPLKNRTQIQACSISVMIVAIVIISFVLVNFITPSFTCASSINSTTIVPTVDIVYNTTSSNISSTASYKLKNNNITERNLTVTTKRTVLNDHNNTLFSNILEKIRKNIRTIPKGSKKREDVLNVKDIINKDVLSQNFCSCKVDEICMLDENTGKSVCTKAVDINDPTGCGGLCALETEACQLVDKLRGVRVCRKLVIIVCSQEEWRCRNGLCVPLETRCDGNIQCYDRSDEMHCECDLSIQFRCGHSISCFANKKLCDGVIDCWDGFDELNCTAECPDHQFTCTDGQCIHSSLFCDGLADCADGSDEPYGCDGACGAHEMRCNNHRCVPRGSRCDGHDNCGDATDEIQCS